MAAFGQQQQVVQQQDQPVPNAPKDGVSSLALTNNLMVATSFDKSVTCWQVQRNQMNQVQAQPAAQVQADGPVLCSDFNQDGSVCYFAGVDNQGRGEVRAWQLGQPTAQTIGRHDKPIKCVQYVNIQNQQLVVTGGWDNKVNFWDTRQPNPIQSIQVAQRVYAMDARPGSALMVVATADVPQHERQPNSPELRYVYTFNLQDFQRGQPHSFDPSPLKYQTRCIASFPDQSGYAIGSIEGRVAIQHVDQAKKDKNFAFKCHRQPGQPMQGKGTSEVYAVNAITFHPLGTFATAGSDGVFNFWDKDSKQRLKNFPRCPGPISAAKFSPDGNIFAYSVSYDWHKGREYYNAAEPNNIFLHAVEASEVQPRPMKGKQGRGR